MSAPPNAYRTMLQKPQTRVAAGQRDGFRDQEIGEFKCSPPLHPPEKGKTKRKSLLFMGKDIIIYGKGNAQHSAACSPRSMLPYTATYLSNYGWKVTYFQVTDSNVTYFLKGQYVNKQTNNSARI